jgi:hypothetical protein
MTTKTLIATTAAATLALPGAALADRPDDKPAKPTKPAKAKGVGFSVGGVDLSGLTVTDGKLAGALTLDPTSANKHARRFLELSKADVKGEKTVPVGTAGDAVIVKYRGLTATDTIQTTDRVKVVGKLVGGKTLDIRKITITRGETKTETEKPKPAETTTAQKRENAARKCKGKSKRKAAGEKKSAYAKCVSAAAKAQNDDKPQS